jgi:flagellar basal-body rod protein FlgG
MAVDFTQGSLVESAGPLELALKGDRFFVVETAHGERAYTRNGQFKINGQQRLVTADGDFVLGFGVDENGNVVEKLVRLEFSTDDVRAADGSAARFLGFSIKGDGRILGHYGDGITRTLGRIPVARFANPNGLVGIGGSKFVNGVNSGPAEIALANYPFRPPERHSGRSQLSPTPGLGQTRPRDARNK